MKKLILTLLTLASLTACKKDIVEPVVENTAVNKLPKRVYFDNSDSSKLDSTSYGDFIYNEKGLLKTFIKYYMSNKISSIEYEYSGNNVSKITHGDGNSIWATYVYQYENNLLKSISNSNHVKPEISYHYKNGIIDYILYEGPFGIFDSVTVTSNQNETIFQVHSTWGDTLGGQTFRTSQKSIRVFKNSNSILDSSLITPYTYNYLNKPITLQDEVIDRLDINDNVKMNFPYIYKLNLYKLILNGYSYSFDSHDRFTTIKSQLQLNNAVSTYVITKYTKIIY